MGVKFVVILTVYLIGLTSADVTLKGEWMENSGWEITCSWQTMINDTLQSLRMYRNGDQFLVYRPETKGMSFSESFRSDEFLMAANCRLASLGGQRGKCVVRLELYLNATEDTYRCETSGERPTFKLEAQEYTVLVPPTDAVVKQIVVGNSTDGAVRPTINCTSSGLPAPRLQWTVEGQKIPEDFTHTRWNSTTKLWDSWSSYNPQELYSLVTCTSEVVTKSGHVVRAQPAQWVVTENSSSNDSPQLCVLIFSMFGVLLR